MIELAIQSLVEGKDLDEGMTYASVTQIMEGKASEVQIAAFLTGLRVKGETVDEMTGGARSLADQCVRIHPDVPFCVDPVGTGGDKTGTVNISSMAALLASAAGAVVAKHGNRSVSSKSGSADLYEALGIRIDLKPESVRRCIEELGFGFMFAPVFHPAMRHAAPVRRQLGVRTLFNILGPLSNPAKAHGQVLGVYDAAIMPFIAQTLVNLGVTRAMVVHGSDGSDEITLAGTTQVLEITDGEIRTYVITPEQFGFKTCTLQDLQGGSPEENARIARDVLSGKEGPALDVTLLNAGATLHVGKAADSMAEGIEMARQAVRTGAALRHLGRIARFTQEIGENDS